MIAKILAGAVMALGLSSAAPMPSPDSTEAILVGCRKENGVVSFGTAWRVHADTILTAAHVVGKACYVRGPNKSSLRAEIVHVDGANDVAALKLPSRDKGLAIDCGVVRAGRSYRAIGYAAAAYRMRNEVIGTGRAWPGPSHRGMAIFEGNAIPGMSGGPILYRGRVIAIVTAGSPSDNRMLGRQLKDTFLCRR
jgi:hypothetical protein